MFAARYKRIGNKIKYYRRARDFEQVDFAEEIGITPQYLSKIERGVARPSMDLMFTIAKHLQINVCELIEDNDKLNGL